MTDATIDLKTCDLAVLNSLTKYPSIPTHHQLDPKNGTLLDVPVVFPGTVIGTEKVDGTNGRIVVLPDGNYVIGSREELLYARGDLIGNPALGIVAALKPVAEALCRAPSSTVAVFFLEVFGGKVTAASKQYTSALATSARLFDCIDFTDFASHLTMEPARIASWRDSGGQRFLDEANLQGLAERHGLMLTPRLFAVSGADLPASTAGMQSFLHERLPKTQCALDAAAGGKPEGIVLRSPDRSTITKARLEDYERTMRRRR
jgi:RNA ligase